MQKVKTVEEELDYPCCLCRNNPCNEETWGDENAACRTFPATDTRKKEPPCKS